MSRIFWVESESLFKSLLVSAIERDGQYQLVGQEPALTEWVASQIHAKDPNVLVVGISRLDTGIAKTIEALRAAMPKLAVVVLLATVEPVSRECLSRLDAGDGPGYALLAEYGINRFEDLLTTIQTVLEGRVVIDRKLLPREGFGVAQGRLNLTKRESEVLRLMARGLTNMGIAERLCITPKTVERHTQGIYSKAGTPPEAIQPRAHAVSTFQSVVNESEFERAAVEA